MKLNYIDIVHIPTAWPSVCDFISDGMRYSNDRYNSKIIVDNLLTGAMQLWVLTDDSNEAKMSMITQVMTYPTGLKVCEVFVIGGVELKKWVLFAMDKICLWAKDMNCTKVQAIGRPGWERVLKGWSKLAVMVEITLGE